MFQVLLNKKAGPEDFKKAFEAFDFDVLKFYDLTIGSIQVKAYFNFSGKISSKELMKVLTEFGEMKLSLEEAEEMISMVDTDKDNMMDYMEFVTLFTQ